MNHQQWLNKSDGRRSGIALVEAAFAVLIVGLMLVAAIQTVGASRATQLQTADASRAEQLAQGLMAEILAQPYADPNETNVLGPEADETGSTRAYFNDVDDYNGWTGSPPQTKDGQPLPGFSGWTRSVTVAYADPTDLAKSASSDTGVKRITVVVKKGDLPLATLTTIRTDGWSNKPSDPGIVTGNEAPVAVAAAGRTSAAVGQAIQFDGSGSRDSDGDALEYVWDFGDGSSATGVSVSHAYAAAGTYSVRLTVTDSQHNQSSDELTVTVSAN